MAAKLDVSVYLCDYGTDYDAMGIQIFRTPPASGHLAMEGDAAQEIQATDTLLRGTHSEHSLLMKTARGEASQGAFSCLVVDKLARALKARVASLQWKSAQYATATLVVGDENDVVVSFMGGGERRRPDPPQEHPNDARGCYIISPQLLLGGGRVRIDAASTREQKRKSPGEEAWPMIKKTGKNAATPEAIAEFQARAPTVEVIALDEEHAELAPTDDMLSACASTTEGKRVQCLADQMKRRFETDPQYVRGLAQTGRVPLVYFSDDQLIGTDSTCRGANLVGIFSMSLRDSGRIDVRSLMG